MINTTTKMRRTQQKARDYLLKEVGADLVWFIQHGRWTKDIWNLWDGFFIKHGRMHLIQVKTNNVPSLKPFKEFYNKYGIPFMILIWKDRAGFKIVDNLAFVEAGNEKSN